jgi:hypothetical protein
LLRLIVDGSFEFSERHLELIMCRRSLRPMKVAGCSRIERAASQRSSNLSRVPSPKELVGWGTYCRGGLAKRSNTPKRLTRRVFSRRVKPSHTCMPFNYPAPHAEALATTSPPSIFSNEPHVLCAGFVVAHARVCYLGPVADGSSKSDQLHHPLLSSKSMI